MADQNSQLNAQIKKLTQRVSALEAEQGNVSYDMPDVVRQNIQKAVIAGTQYLGNISGASPAVIETVPTFLQLNYNGKLWNVNVNAYVASGSGAPTFDAPAGTLYLRTDYTFNGTPALYINQNGGTTWYGFVLNANVMSGGGIPGFAAPQGTIYANTSASTSTTRLYINKDGTNNWASFTASS